MKTGFSLLALMAFFIIGLYIVGLSPNSKFELPGFHQSSSTISRDPAAIRKNYDFSMLEGSALESASKQRLLSGAKIIELGEEIGVELGHFVVRGENGEKSFACQKYSQIALIFSGEGMAVNGELPTMEVEGNCEASADINSISPLMIPIAKILGETVAEGEFNFREGQNRTVKFSHVSDQWPRTWHLQAVRLYDKESGQEMKIAPAELRDFLPKPITVNFVK